MEPVWKKTACILCESNCGIEVRLDGREFTRIRGNKEHVESAGYTCEKALRLNHYQNNRGRLTSPMRRRDDGTYEEIDWDTAVAEVATRLAAVRDEHGGASIFRYGGGGQGNHLGGTYGMAVADGLGSLFRSNAIAQEKTGEAYVEARMFGAHTRPEFDRSEVAIFVGKNPWQTHGFAHARTTLKAIANDPDRSMIVLDPKRTKTAELADYHLQLRPGTDAFCIAAILAIMVRDGLLDTEFVEQHLDDAGPLLEALADVPIEDYAQRCDVPLDQLQAVAERIGRAESVASFEDLGIEQAPNSTLVSYLQRLLWVLVGSFGKAGGCHPHSNYSIRGSSIPRAQRPKYTPVTGALVIAGLIPCNSIPEEVLTDHPDRFRAILIEGSNPVHSLADSKRFREMMRALDFSVVIDVAMTETARQADIVLPASSQYEKPECVFFNFHFPKNAFYLRKPIVAPTEGTLAEPEIHARIGEALGLYDPASLEPLNVAAAQGREAFATAFDAFMDANPELKVAAPLILYRTLGPTLPDGLAGAAVLWDMSRKAAEMYPDAMRRAGIDDTDAPSLGDALFDAVLASDDGVIFTEHTYDEAWDLTLTTDRQLRVNIPIMIDKLRELVDLPTEYTTDEFPLVLAAGERRSFTANVILRDPSWRRRDAEGALAISPADATRHGLLDGDRVRVVTAAGAAEPIVMIDEAMREGHISLPNGFGVEFPDEDGEHRIVGVSPNELTSLDWKDDIAGTPWHKHVPARLEPLQTV